jgi:hypothetical protein
MGRPAKVMAPSAPVDVGFYKVQVTATTIHE